MYAGTANWVHQAGIVALEAGRREAMDYLGSGKCASLLEAIEYAVDEPDLRVALYLGCPGGESAQ
jgi:hypothetical protein